MDNTDLTIDHGKSFDWGKVSEDYAKYRDIYPVEFYNRIIETGIGLKGQRILDIGTGTGVIPRNMYKYGAMWTGVDISQNQIKYARKLSEDNGYNINYIVSAGENLEVPDKLYDAVTACQCFVYFNKQKMIPKIHNMLKKDGHFVILFMAWLSDESEIARKSEELVLKYNPDWTGAGMKRKTPEEPEWAKPLFTVDKTDCFDIPVTFTRESWHGRIKTCRGIGASSLTPKQINAWEKEHLQYLETLPPSFEILHYATILNLKKIEQES